MIKLIATVGISLDKNESRFPTQLLSYHTLPFPAIVPIHSINFDARLQYFKSKIR